MLIGPVGLARGLAIMPLWLEAAAAPVVAVFIVDRLRRRQAGRIALAGLALGAGLALLLQVDGITVGGLLSAAGLSGRAFVPGLVTLGVTASIGAALAIADGLRPSGRAVLVGAAAASMVLLDVSVISRGIDRANALRDLELYLLAGERFVDGLQPYQLTPVGATLVDQSLYPYLYSPPLLPLLGFLSALPWPVVATLSIATSGAAAVAALRVIGVRWVWVPIFLLWPPFFEGIWVGNVAIISALLLCIAFARPGAGGLLVLGALFKPQALVPALWLVRERRWRALVTGFVVAGAIAVATLPFVGIGAWFDWLQGLRAFQESVVAMPVLHAFALPAFVPYPAFIALAVVAVGWALLARGRLGLQRLGVASIVASPTLYGHGLLAMLPALATLNVEIVLLVLGSYVSGLGLWFGVGVVVVALTLTRWPTATERVPSDR
ncbi:MAG TPA: glycosyltransferase family 87 protein [Candidatus Limnocylindrales bacterium]|nr:glycosyltransferase family 87 protein [Candidatus Limnocylindrales bacterium]